MFISSFQLNNYKSYYQSKPLVLSPGINLVVGPNHAGKTALLEGLRLDFLFNPYRSSRLHRRIESKEKLESSAAVSFTLNHDELRDILRNVRDHFGVPLPDGLLPKIHFEGNEKHTRVQRFVDGVFNKKLYTLDALYAISKEHSPGRLTPAKFPSFGDYKVGGTSQKHPFAWCRISDEGRFMVVGTQVNGDERFDLGVKILDVLKERLYNFKAERFNVGKYVAGLGRKLESDASNLPEVLGNLLGETPAKFRLLNRHFQTIFPQIYEVSARNVAGDSQTFGPSREVIIYEIESTDPEDAIPLNHSGTGLGQVLAMLYVLVESKQPQVIIIDEPQSFLHPGAIRKLFEIFNLYPQHQYIISTHLPYIIHAAKPTTITLVTKERGHESQLQSIGVNETQELSICFDQVGARLSDAYGADNILWVEGPTERDCFPLILEKYSQQRLMGTEVVPVISVDEILGKGADRVVGIYKQLSQGKGLRPPAVGFIFDRECRNKDKRADLERQLGRSVRFINRRMYENYLLEPKAIAAVLKEQSGINKRSVTAVKIKNWLEKEVKKPGYLCHVPDEPWINIIDGAKVLGNLFSHFSHKTVSYKKVEHGVILTKWLLDSDVGELKEVAILIEDLLNKDSNSYNQMTI
jgi:predicted ATPase